MTLTNRERIIIGKMRKLQACNFIKKRLEHKCFPEKFAKYLRTPILKNICKRLLLQIEINSIKGKFDNLVEVTENQLDTLVIFCSKIRLIISSKSVLN